MKTSKILAYSFLCSTGVILYTMLVAYILLNIPKLLGNSPNIGGVAVFLLLFVVSALITGLLVLGGPLHLYFAKKLKQAVYFLAFNISWLILIGFLVVLLR